MPLLIDGHNLIGSGAFHNIHIGDEDDEAKLVARLVVFKSHYRDKITVIFDKGVTEGKDPALSRHGVEVYFARDPNDADDRILDYIRKRIPGLIVVTNDGDIRAEAAEHDVETWTSNQFIQRIDSAKQRREPSPADLGENLYIHESEAEREELLKKMLNRAGGGGIIGWINVTPKHCNHRTDIGGIGQKDSFSCALHILY